jgi:hypothetical protein
MAKQQLVVNKEDILQNIRTFDAYKTGSDVEKKFYKRGVKNVEHFVAMIVDVDTHLHLPTFRGTKKTIMMITPHAHQGRNEKLPNC